MALQSVHGPIKVFVGCDFFRLKFHPQPKIIQILIWQVGSVLPNIARCINPLPANPSPSDVELWLNKLKHLATHSHLRGTCLLTAQQAMVDITSNYKTSLTAYSSVNMLFMLAVILWISASFALFYLGGGPKTMKEIEELPGSDGTKKYVMEDLTMAVGILWNLLLVAYLLFPDTLEKSNIPLNNAVIAIVALMAAIAVQWHSAYYSAKKFDQLYTLKNNVPEEKEAVEERASFGTGNSKFFTTTNFLSVANHSFQKKNGYQMIGLPFARPNYYEALKVCDFSYRSINLQFIDKHHVDIVENFEYCN